MPNLLSVVIPVFNEERTVVSMLDRVAAAQTLDLQLELVIVNDGSTDHTGEILARLAAEDGRLICLEANFLLRQGDREQIRARMDELNRRRREKQPLSYPSAGSTFKRPEGHFAGALIEQAGLKGLSAGGAQVSEKHAGFIINTGGATARDVLELIETVKKRVYDMSGVMLEPEVRITGED